MTEETLDPGLQICDPHHHLYPDGSFVHTTYLVEDLARDTATRNVVSTVYVETSGSVYRDGGPTHLQPVGETEWVMSMATDGLMQGIVGFADLLLGERVEEVLDAHLEAAGSRFKGIRYREMVLGQPEPPHDFFELPEIRQGAEVLLGRNLVLEVLTTFDVLPSAAAFARSLPELRIVLGHVGMPLITEAWAGRREEVLDMWRQGIGEIAACENVVVKLGGIGMPYLTDPTPFSEPPTSAEIAAHWAPEITFLIEQFGTTRCMFESNFPIDDALCDYATLWNAFERIVAHASDAERADLFHDTAAAFFGVP